MFEYNSDNNAKKLSNTLLKGSDAKHIPEQFKNELAKFLSMLDFSSNRMNDKTVANMMKLHYLYRDIANNETGDLSEFGLKTTKVINAKGESLIVANRNIDKIISQKIEMPVYVAEEPIEPVVEEEKPVEKKPVAKKAPAKKAPAKKTATKKVDKKAE